MNGTDKDFVLVYYSHPNVGQHKVVGYATKTNYGYRAGGDRFYVNRQDIAAQPSIYKIIEENVIAPEVKTVPPPPPVEVVSPPEEIAENIMESNSVSLETVPGITPAIRAQLNAEGVHSLDELIEFGEEGLLSLKGVGKTRAVTIYSFAKDYIAKHSEG
jgi:hypothetical protein